MALRSAAAEIERERRGTGFRTGREPRSEPATRERPGSWPSFLGKESEMNLIAFPIVAEDSHGWRDGAPLSVPSEVVLIDLTTYRRMRCPKCGQRGFKAVPQHNAAGAYRVLCSCRTCPHVEVC
jgi:hypothetical protein